MEPLPVTLNLAADGAWARFVLFHPKGNIVTAEMVSALREAFRALGSMPRVKLVSIEGQGANFSYGASIPEHTAAEIERVLPEMHRLIEEMLAIPAPTAAIVRGRCLGGGFELALACDFMFASDDAVFGLPEIALGVFPPAASALLPMRLGYARASRATLTGETRPAAEWEASGLLALVADSASLESAVEDWIQQHLAPRSAAALRHAALAVRLALREHVARTLPALERQYLDELMKTHDANEGVHAFLEKRPPRWADA